MSSTRRYTDIHACVQRVAHALGDDLRVFAPGGLGQPSALLNALYALTRANPRRSLRLYTGTTGCRPQARNALEVRFVTPLAARRFGAANDTLLARDQAADRLPANVAIHTLGTAPGWSCMPGHDRRNAIVQDVTAVARDLVGQDVNLLVQRVARRDGPDGVHYSLASDPGITLDFLRLAQAAGVPRPLCVAVVHPDMPWVGGSAQVDVDFFDLELEAAAHPLLFAIPREPVSVADHALGLHASALLADGGCLRMDAGARCDALVNALLLRQRDNTLWRRGLLALDATGQTHALARWTGGLSVFDTGLYGSAGVLGDGYMHLQRAGILKRRSWDNLALERAAAEGRLAADVPGGHYLRAAAFLGSRALYRWLAQMQADDAGGIDMAAASVVNQQDGATSALGALQRRGARCFVSGAAVTPLGAVLADTGQGDLLASDHGDTDSCGDVAALVRGLPDARMIVMLRAVHDGPRGLESSITWNAGDVLLPQQARDIVVTEYGVADLRGKSNGECVEALLSIADARFIDRLCDQAKARGVLDTDFVIPVAWRRHRPRYLHEALQPLARRGHLPLFPFGSDLTEVEQRLLAALGWLRARKPGAVDTLRLLLASLRPSIAADEGDALIRMGLGVATGWREHVQRRVLLAALRHQRRVARRAVPATALTPAASQAAP